MDAGTIYLLIAVVLILISAIKNMDKTKQALIASWKIALTILPVLFFIFVLMGLVEALVSNEIIASWLGTGNGIVTVLVGEIAGSIALIQPAAVFPFAGFLHDSGANYGAIYGFVMTAILVGISTLPLEIKLFGKKFTLIRNSLTISMIFLIGIFFKILL